MTTSLLYSKGSSNRPFPQEKNLSGNDYRSEFRKDFGRLVHSSSFRRLQGKTQLFPGAESDFFRNRLTHSLEVAQVGKGIAIFINENFPEFKNDKIDLDLVEFAGLAHDLGHPPFGHNGEKSLDQLMKKEGGFEGNAQTLRILSTLEKKVLSDENRINDLEGRRGLNLTFRSLASILKYDKKIPKRNSKIPLIKGYYYHDKGLINNIKNAIIGESKLNNIGKFKTIECCIMDIADDIAYSTYDFEDSLKAGFLHILDPLATDPRTNENSILDEVTKRVNRNISKNIDKRKLVFIYLELLSELLGVNFGEQELNENDIPIIETAKQFESLKQIGEDGFQRTRFTANLINRFINSIEIEYNNKFPALTKVKLNNRKREEVEILKNYVFVSQIMSSRLKVSEFRGNEIIKKIFTSIEKNPRLMPTDFFLLYNESMNKPFKKRIICDFIAGMTDSYAIEFFSRLTSSNAQTIFKPL